MSSPSAKSALYHRLMNASLVAAGREQGLAELAARLEEIVPDLTQQYVTRDLAGEMWLRKVRLQHAFQISLVQRVVDGMDQFSVVDIGDSAGTHLVYLLGLYGPERMTRCLSVNLDEAAVRRIQSKGLDAIHARAEDLTERDVHADVLLSFEMLEHLSDPIAFLHGLALTTDARYLIVTVPFVAKSRVGLHHLRLGLAGDVGAEDTHIFELSPEDWALVARHAGWEVTDSRIYRQYPLRGPLRVTKPLWRARDFEGFLGLTLRPELTEAKRYRDWPDA